MCLICASIDKNVLTPLEAWKNLSEMYSGMEEEHVEEVLERIAKMQVTEDVEVLPGESEENDDFPFVNWGWSTD